MSRLASRTISRRTFLSAGAGVIGAIACGDETAKRGADALDAPEVEAEPADTIADTFVAEIEADSAPEPEDLAAADETVTIERIDPGDILLAVDGYFPIGISAADPAPDGVIAASRYLGLEPLELVVWRVEAATPLELAGELATRRVVEVAAGGYVAAAIDGLAALGEYRFCFVAAGLRSPVGRFRTAPATRPMLPVVRFGATSCAKWDFRPFDVLTRASEASLDFFLLLGDTTYADSATTLDEYRDNWQRNLATSEYRALRASTSIAAIWDDHEVTNNWSPEDVDATRLAAARQAFFEHMTPRRSPLAPERTWRSFGWGGTVDVFLLDGRSERLPSTRNTGAAQYISEAQLAWLEAGLEASQAVFKIVCTAVPITAWPTLYLAKDQRWEGYATQRERVLAICEKIPGLVWVAGDFHFGAVAQVDPPGGAHFAQTEVLVGPVAHVNPALAVVQLTGDPAQFQWTSGERNYGRFTCDPNASPPSLVIEHVDRDGNVLATHTLV